MEIQGFTKEQWVEVLTQETTRTLWGDSYTFTPVICSEKLGDGEQLIWLSSIDTRPMFWLLFVDSSTDLSEIECDELVSLVEGCFGRHPYANGFDILDKDDFEKHLKETEGFEWKRDYDTYEDYLSACEYPAMLWGGGSWGMIANFKTGEYNDSYISEIVDYFETKS